MDLSFMASQIVRSCEAFIANGTRKHVIPNKGESQLAYTEAGSKQQYFFGFDFFIIFIIIYVIRSKATS